jgi:hypothetical protein
MYLTVLKALVSASCIFSQAPDSTAPTDKTEPPTLEEIERIASERNSKLKCFFVQYEIQSELLGSAEDAKRYLRLMATVNEVKTFAAKGSKRYYDLHRPVGEYAELAPDIVLKRKKVASAKDLPEPVARAQRNRIEREKGTLKVRQKLTTTFDGSILQQWRGDERIMSLMGEQAQAAQGNDLGYFNQEYMWLTYHSMPDVLNPEIDRGEHRLPEALSRLKCSVRPEMEITDGALCAVVDVGDDVVLWIDPQLSCAVRRWQSYEPGTDHVTYEYTLCDFAEITPGAWFPRSCIRKRWAGADAPDRVKKDPLVQYAYTVKEIHANDLPDSLFTMETPIGAHVVDASDVGPDKNGMILPPNYIMPADREKLDDVIAQAKSDLNRALEETKSGGLKPRNLEWRLSLTLIGACIAVAAYFYMVRRPRKA